MTNADRPRGKTAETSKPDAEVGAVGAVGDDIEGRRCWVGGEAGDEAGGVIVVLMLPLEARLGHDHRPGGVKHP